MAAQMYKHDSKYNVMFLAYNPYDRNNVLQHQLLSRSPLTRNNKLQKFD